MLGRNAFMVRRCRIAMNVMIICRGIPASGKTTWAKGWVEESPATRRRVCRDDVRFQMYGKYAGDGIDEYAVTREEHRQIREALGNNLDVVVDATNLNVKTLKKLRSIAHEYTNNVYIESFDISVEEAISRDAVRDKKVGEAVIRMFAERYNIK